MILGLLATRVLSSIVYQATPKVTRFRILWRASSSPCWVLAFLLRSIPARRALAVDPITLLREE